MPSFETVLLVFTCASAVLFIYIILYGIDKRASKNWELIADGVYDRVVYGYHNENRSGGMGSRHTYKMDITVIYFKDGTTCVIEDGRYDVIFPRGTKISISQNGHGEYRFKKIR